MRLARQLTPCGLALTAAPWIFLALASGIPFVYAACDSAYGDDATALTIADCGSCVAGPIRAVTAATPSESFTSRCAVLAFPPLRYLQFPWRFLGVFNLLAGAAVVAALSPGILHSAGLRWFVAMALPATWWIA
jgi:hypothetical protein